MADSWSFSLFELFKARWPLAVSAPTVTARVFASHVEPHDAPHVNVSEGDRRDMGEMLGRDRSGFAMVENELHSHGIPGHDDVRQERERA